MKKYFAIALMLGFVTTVNAQVPKVIPKTITAADTTVFSNVPSKIKSFSYTLLKTSGTVAGKVYLEGSNISGAWDILDSLTLADVATVQKKTTIITATSYLSYRFRNTNTSSATATIKAMYLRRDDE